MSTTNQIEHVSSPPHETTASNAVPPLATVSSPRRQGMGILRGLIIAIVVIGAGFLGVRYFLHNGKATGSVAGGEAKPPANEASASGEAESSGTDQESDSKTRVEYVYPTKGGIERTTRQPGSVQAFQYSDLEANTVSGYLVEQKTPGGGYVDIGTKVKVDDILAKIDDPPLVEEANQAKAVIEQRKAQIAQAEAAVDTAKANKEAAEANVKQTQAAVVRTTANAKFRHIQAKRIKELADTQSVDKRYADEEQAHYEEALGDEETAKAAVLTAAAQVAAARAKILDAQADVLAAKANLSVAEADLKRLEALLKFLVIRSPYNGVVTKRHFHQGDYIRSAGSVPVPLFTVARTDLMRVVVMIPENDVPFCNAGDPAQIQLDALAKRVFLGKIARIADAEDPLQRTMQVEIDLDNKDGTLRDGMFGRAIIQLKASTGQMNVPSGAIQVESKTNKTFVYVIVDGRAVKRYVTQGTDDGIHVELVGDSNIAPTDKVVVKYNGTITNGRPVDAAKAQEKKQDE